LFEVSRGYGFGLDVCENFDHVFDFFDAVEVSLQKRLELLTLLTVFLVAHFASDVFRF